MPFKRVAIDLIGPIGPPCEAGHRYILTLVDYGTRYPEAVPLKNIDTETVAETLVDMFSRLGIPEEILSDLGTQFVSDRMKEVARLLSIKQLTTTHSHPMCYGMTEKFYGTLKITLKRLCSEQPRLWHLRTDASDYGIGAVLMQEHGGKLFPICYASKKLSDAELNYSTIEKECLQSCGVSRDCICICMVCALYYRPITSLSSI
ncbi:protein NYNRIN-like [Orbicella faveolata]|uniref:protein NYNRIN-like n=1 Tax=Orbicella faveolata TaxID=48498 RepID=UPI0009E3E672|nr:protein NYNRIN-like [Orbicella faveolata]